MPAYRTTSKYSTTDNQRIKMAAFAAVAESKKPVSALDIQIGNFDLVNVTPQKISRTLNEIADLGLITKIYPKGSGRIKYITTALYNDTVSISEENKTCKNCGYCTINFKCDDSGAVEYLCSVGDDIKINVSPYHKCENFFKRGNEYEE